ncbi:coiled-coil domain-containing protein 83 [Diretmus argenteus]
MDLLYGSVGAVLHSHVWPFLDTLAPESNNNTNRDEKEHYLLIELKRKEADDLQEEISDLETEKQKHTETLEQLKKEQEDHITALWRQTKEQRRKLEQREVVSREEVEEAQRCSLDAVHAEEAQLTELRRKLIGAEKQVLDLEAECHTWLQYKDTGSREYQAQITNLQEVLDRMQRDFETAADNIKHTLDATLSEIDKETIQLVNEKKQLAAETAIKHLDKFTKEKIKENGWLQTEISIYNQEVSSMEQSVHSLEEENLQHMNWLFEQRMEDLNLSRNVCFTPADGPRDSKKSHDSPTSDINGVACVSVKPPSLRNISMSFPWFAVAGREMGEATKYLEGDETDSSCSSASQDLRVPLDQSQSQQLKDELHLEALELKLLRVVGQAVPLHPRPSEDDDGWDSRAPEERGPLTTRIINDKFQ